MMQLFTYLGMGLAASFIIYRLPTFATNWWQVMLALCGIVGLAFVLRQG